MGFKKFKRLRKAFELPRLDRNTLYPKKDDNLSLSAPPSLVSGTDLRIKAVNCGRGCAKGHPVRTITCPHGLRPVFTLK